MTVRCRENRGARSMEVIMYAYCMSVHDVVRLIVGVRCIERPLIL